MIEKTWTDQPDVEIEEELFDCTVTSRGDTYGCKFYKLADGRFMVTWGTLFGSASIIGETQDRIMRDLRSALKTPHTLPQPAGYYCEGQS